MAINRANQNWPDAHEVSADPQDICPNCGHVIADGEFTTGVGFNNTGTAHVRCPEVQSQTAGK